MGDIFGGYLWRIPLGDASSVQAKHMSSLYEQLTGTVAAPLRLRYAYLFAVKTGSSARKSTTRLKNIVRPRTLN